MATIINVTAISVTAPIAGQSVPAGQPFNITWVTTGPVASHVVRLSTDGGSTFSDLSGPLGASIQSYSWSVPATQAQAEIRVVAKDSGGNVLARADSGVFTIQMATQQPTTVSVSAPLAGQSIPAGQPFTIRWVTTGPVASHVVRLSTDGGSTFSDLSGPLGASIQSYSWSVPATQAQAEIRVVAKDANGNMLARGDSGVFTIQIATQQPTTVSVSAPLAGQSIPAAQPFTIRWVTTGPVVSHIVRLSTDGGSTFSDLSGALPASAQLYVWSVPAAAQSQVVVRVVARDANGNQLARGDSGRFSIQQQSAAPLTVSSPGAGTYRGHERVTAQWSTSQQASSFTVKLSLDGGTTFSTVVSNLGAGTMSYRFVLPDPSATASAVVRVVGSNAAGQIVAQGDSARFTVRRAHVTPKHGTIKPQADDTVAAGGNVTLDFGYYYLPDDSDPSILYPDVIALSLSGVRSDWQAPVPPTVEAFTGDNQAQSEILVSITTSLATPPGDYTLTINGQSTYYDDVSYPPLTLALEVTAAQVAIDLELDESSVDVGNGQSVNVGFRYRITGAPSSDVGSVLVAPPDGNTPLTVAPMKLPDQGDGFIHYTAQISATKSAAPGAYAVVVSVSSTSAPSVVEQRTITVTVQEASLQLIVTTQDPANPTVLSLLQGGSGTFDITVQKFSYDGAIAYSLDPAMAGSGLTFVFGTEKVGKNQNTNTLTVTAAAGADVQQAATSIVVTGMPKTITSRQAIEVDVAIAEPEVTDITFTPPTTVRPGATVSIPMMCKVSHALATDSIRVTTDGGDGVLSVPTNTPPQDPPMVDKSGNATFSIMLPIKVAGDAPNGTMHSITITAQDSRGGKSFSKMLMLKVDSFTVTLAISPSMAAVKAGQSATVTASVTASLNPGEKVQVLPAQTTGLAITPTTPAAAVPPFSIQFNVLATGETTGMITAQFEATAEDHADVSNRKSFAATVSRETVNIMVRPPSGRISQGQSIEFEVSLSPTDSPYPVGLEFTTQHKLRIVGSFSPESITGAETARLTVSAPRKLHSPMYTFTVGGTAPLALDLRPSMPVTLTASGVTPGVDDLPDPPTVPQPPTPKPGLPRPGLPRPGLPIGGTDTFGK